MRRFNLVMAILILLGATLFANQETFESTARFLDLRTLAMGGAGVALADTPEALYKNPATLYHHSLPMFHLGVHLSEDVGREVVGDDFAPYVQNPSNAFEILLSNRYIALSIALSNILEERNLTPEALYFMGYNESRIQLTLSYGWPIISLGFFARGGNRSEREVELRKAHVLTDYFRETMFERYRGGTSDAQLFSTGVGVLLTYQWIAIGIMSDSLFSYDATSNELTLDLRDLYTGLTVGIAFSSPIYNRNNELNRIVFNLAFDLTNLGDSAERSINIGIEGKILFLSTVWLALRGGYVEKRESDSPLFAIDGTGTITFGLGSQIGRVNLAFATLYSLKEDNWRLQAALKWAL